MFCLCYLAFFRAWGPTSEDRRVRRAACDWMGLFLGPLQMLVIALPGRAYSRRTLLKSLVPAAASLYSNFPRHPVPAIYGFNVDTIKTC